MPRGPSGERQPADAIGCAVRVAQIATGEVEEKLSPARHERARAGDKREWLRRNPVRRCAVRRRSGY